MSGGSYNYFYQTVPAELEQQCSTITDIVKVLVRLGMYNSITVAVLTKIGLHMRAHKELLQEMSEVLQAVEWHESSDWTKEQVVEAVENYDKQAVEESEYAGLSEHESALKTLETNCNRALDLSMAMAMQVHPAIGADIQSQIEHQIDHLKQLVKTEIDRRYLVCVANTNAESTPDSQQ